VCALTRRRTESFIEGSMNFERNIVNPSARWTEKVSPCTGNIAHPSPADQTLPRASLTLSRSSFLTCFSCARNSGIRVGSAAYFPQAWRLERTGTRHSNILVRMIHLRIILEQISDVTFPKSFQSFFRIKREIDRRINWCNSTFNIRFFLIQFFFRFRGKRVRDHHILQILHTRICSWYIDGEFSCYGTTNFDGAHDVRRKIHW